MKAPILLCLLWPGLADAACRQALALGLDVSGSVDAVEYRLQLDGLAAALGSPAVRDVLFARPDAPVDVLVYEWSGPAHQNIIIPWQAITNDSSLAAITSSLRNHERLVAPPSTAIGSALIAGFGFLNERPDCWKRTLDLSGDGPSNTGPRPQAVFAENGAPQFTVNALVIGSGNLRGDDERFADIKALSSYYRADVIRGPGAFVEVALGFEDYAAAMERKLLRELASIVVGNLSVE